MSDENFLSRWSRRKHAAAAGVRSEDAAPATAPVPPGAAGATPASAVSAEPAPPAELPPVASLSIESDFAPFMAKEVDPSLQRAALRKLFQDERFNVMDGLDVYIDDYTKADPLPEGWLEKMEAVARLGVYRPPLEAEADEAPEAEAGDMATAAEAPALEADAEEAPDLVDTVPEEAAAEPSRTEPQRGGT